MAVTSSWSDCLPELLNVVFHSLNEAGDILRCTTVCSSWRDSSFPVYSSKFIPSLFVSHTSSDEEARISDKFRVLSPGNLDVSGKQRTWVCGSTQGFLLTVNASYPFKINLINPCTHTVASLPPLIAFEDVQRLLQSQAISPDSETLKNFVKKAVSSTSLLEPDWVVLVIYNTDRKLAFCRRGDKQWTDLESDPEASSVDDIVFCNGFFYAIDRTGEVYYCELSSTNPNLKAVPLCRTSPFRYDPCKKYFAESDCEVLWVVLMKVELNDDCDFTTYFVIYEFSSKTNEWTKVRSLRGKALFLSPQGSCIAVFAGETGSRGFVKGNSVYFIDGNDSSTGLGSQNLSVFDWESKEVEKMYQPRSWNCHMFWVTPTDVVIQH